MMVAARITCETLPGLLRDFRTASDKSCGRGLGTRLPGRVVTRYSFSKLFSSAWMKAMTMANIVSGFRVTGVYPVNRNTIQLPEESSQPSLPEATGLAFIPLYSPLRHHAKTSFSGL